MDKSGKRRKDKIRINALLSFVLSLVLLGSWGVMLPESNAAGYGGLDAETHTKQEIIDYVKAHPWNMDSVEYASEPSITQPYSAGELSESTKTSALNYLNIFRYIAGVSETKIDSAAMEDAQAASLVMAINRELEHYISTRPDGMSDELYEKAVRGAANSNIAGGGESITNTILRYMLEVNGAANFGHRRQLLKPVYSGAGFGSARSASGSYYSATYVDAYLNENKAISYPGQMQPLEYFGTGYAWTVVVPQKVDAASAVITVKDTKTGKVWEFRNNSDSGDYQYMRVDADSRSACFIFAPEDIIYRDGDVYTVTITGIPSPISYDVNMFYIENIPVESVRLNNYVPSTVKGRSVTGPSSVVFTPSDASNRNMIWTSSDDSIASVKNYGAANYEITGHKEGKVTITGIPEGGSGEVHFEFEVKPEPTGIDAPDEITVGVGQTYSFTPRALPAECGVSVTLYGNDSSIAKAEGFSKKEITGVKVGTTQFKAHLYYGQSTDTTYDHLDKTITVRVVEPKNITKLSINGPDEVDLGEEAVFTADIEPADATLRQVEWSSPSYYLSNLGDGVFKAQYYPGKRTVTVKAKDGSGVEASKEITVYDKYDTPAVPSASSVTATSVTISGRNNYEYSLDGTNWQSSQSFTGLKPETEYRFYQRRAENLNSYMRASDSSEPLVVTTLSCDHSWDEGKVTKQATTAEEGVKTYTCTICNEVKTESIPKLDPGTDTPADDPGTDNPSDQPSTDPGTDNPSSQPSTGPDTNNQSDKPSTDTGTNSSSDKPSTDAGMDSPSDQPSTDPGTDSPSDTPSVDSVNQTGIDGTALGAGASVEAAEAAIASMTSDRDLPGSVFNKLQLRSKKQTNTSISLSWKKVSGAKNYVIYGNQCGRTKKMKRLAVSTGNSKKFTKVLGKKLKKGTYYKFMIVALDSDNKVVSSSKIIHVATKGGKVGNVSKVTTKAKKNKVTIKRGKTFKLAGKQVAASKKLKIKAHRKLSYESSNPKIAKVSKKGVITGKKKGTCYVYAYAQNGVFAKIKIIIK